MALLTRSPAATKTSANTTRTAGKARLTGAWPDMRMPGAAIAAPIIRRMNGGAPGDVRAAIDAGWLAREPDKITKRALKAIDHETLWCALHLDTDDEARAFVKSLRERCQRWAADARTLRRCTALIERAIGPELESALARTRADARRSGETLADLELARDHLAASATIAEIWHLRLKSAVARADHRRSRRYAGFWRAEVLAWLLRVLGEDWTRRDLAKLISASNTDFTRAPCPAFVGDADIDRLTHRIKRMLARHK